MNSKYILKTLFIITAISFTHLSYSLAETEPEKKEMMMKEEMKKWMEYATPGEHHKKLDYFVGEWDYTIKWWMSPDSKPESATGTTKNIWLLDGRFLKIHAKGNSTEQPFEGYGIMGYDNMSKKYRGTWIDNMGTGMMNSWGQYYPSGNRFVEHGKFNDPLHGKRLFKGVTTIINNDKYTYEMYITGPDGTEFKNMILNYTRKK